MKTWKPFKRDDNSINAVLDMVYGFQRSRVLLTASELGLFSVIGTDQKSAKEVAMTINSNERATQRLMDALCSMDLLIKVGDKYSNSQLSLRFLVKTKPEYMSIMDNMNNLWKSWGTLTKSVKNGTAVACKNIADMNKVEVEGFLDWIHWRSTLLAPDIVKLINLNNVNKILDIGGGLGEYSFEFVMKNPQAKATIITYPNVVPFTKDYIKRRNVSDKVDVISGDFFNDDIGSGYDLIFCSFIIEYNNIWDNIEFAKKLYSALNHGGQVVIQDLLISDDRTKPEFNALYSLELLCNTKAGDTYTSSEIWILLKEAWFDQIETIETDFGTSLVFAKKF